MYIYQALFAAVCFALGTLINKFQSKHSINNKDSLMAYFMLSSASFSLLLLPFVSFELPSLQVWLLLLASAIPFLVGYYFFYWGILTTDASSVAPLFQVQAALIGIWAFLFLGERFPLINYFWMVLMLVGAVLISFTKSMSVKSFFNRGVGFILLMQVFHSVSNVFIGFVLKQLSPVDLLFWQNFIIFVALILFIVSKRPTLKYHPREIAPMFLTSTIIGAGVVSLFTAFSQNLTISSLLGLLSAPIVFVVSVIASRFYPQLLENHPPKVYLVRGIGLTIIITSAIFISFG